MYIHIHIRIYIYIYIYTYNTYIYMYLYMNHIHITADTNHDQQLSYDEFKTGVLPVLSARRGIQEAENERFSEALFNIFDKNKDGVLSKVEILRVCVCVCVCVCGACLWWCGCVWVVVWVRV